MAGNSILVATIFALTVPVTYMIIRRGLVQVRTAIIAGIVYTSVSFFVFALWRENPLFQAVMVGLIFGPLSTFVAAKMAMYFRVGEIGQEVISSSGPISGKMKAQTQDI